MHWAPPNEAWPLSWFTNSARNMAQAASCILAKASGIRENNYQGGPSAFIGVQTVNLAGKTHPCLQMNACHISTPLVMPKSF